MEISEVYQKNKESDRQCKDCAYYVENYEDDFTIRNFGYGEMVNRPACSFGGTYGFVAHNPARTCEHYKKSESEENQMIEEKESPEHDRYEYYCNGINITNCKWLRVDPIPHCGIDSARSCTLECSHYESFVAEQSKSSEGIKYDSGKPRLGEMVIDFRKPLVEVAKVWAFGADKYAKSNWQKVENGQDRYTNAMLRHLVAEAESETDKESELLHAAHVAWNALARLHFIMTERDE